MQQNNTAKLKVRNHTHTEKGVALSRVSFVGRCVIFSFKF